MSNKALYLLLLIPLLLGGGIYVGREELLRFYLFRLGVIPTLSSSFSIPLPEVIPPSGPSEKLLGKILLFFPWDLEGEIVHSELGPLPFSLSLRRDRGQLWIKTAKGSLDAEWRGKKRWVTFENFPLSFISSFPEGVVNGEWIEEKGLNGNLSISLEGGTNLDLEGDGDKVILRTPELSLRANLELNLPQGGVPGLLLTNGEGELFLQDKIWNLKEIVLESARGVLKGQLSQEDTVPLFNGITLLKGIGPFQYDLKENRLSGSDFEGELEVCAEERKFLLSFWELDRLGGAFEAWIEKEGLLKGAYTPLEKGHQIHLFEGSTLGGVALGPFRVTLSHVVGEEKIEGAIRADLSSLVHQWSRWMAIQLPPYTPLEGKFEGEVLLTRKGGDCFLEGRDLVYQGWPIASASFDVSFAPDRLMLKEGKVEELSFAFDAFLKEGQWDLPFIYLMWRDLLKVKGTGSSDSKGYQVKVEDFKGDMELLEAYPLFQPLLHRFDLKGAFSGKGNVSLENGEFKSELTVKGEEIRSFERLIPFLKETQVRIDDKVTLKGGEFFLDGHLLKLEEGTITGDQVHLHGTGAFSFQLLSNQLIEGPWAFDQGIFSGVVEFQPHGQIFWSKKFDGALKIETPLYALKCEMDDRGCVKGKWGEGVTFDLALRSGGKGEGKAFFNALPRPNVTLESPLPLQAEWVFPTNGQLPFRLDEKGIEILPGGELFSEGKGIRYEKVEGSIGWLGTLDLKLAPKAYRLPLYWLERGEITLRGSIQEPKLEVKWR